MLRVLQYVQIQTDDLLTLAVAVWIPTCRELGRQLIAIQEIRKGDIEKLFKSFLSSPLFSTYFSKQNLFLTFNGT